MGYEWTLEFWSVLPKAFDTGSPKTLIMSNQQNAYFQIDESGSRMGLVDDSGQFIDAGIDLKSKMFRIGWHHIGVVYSQSHGNQFVSFYLDGRHLHKST